MRQVSTELQARGWFTPKRAHKRSGFGGNKPFSRGHLYRILGNPIYAGMVAHRGEVHPGQHPAIVEKTLWDEVQQRLEANRQGHKTQSHADNPSLLSGKVFDETGRRLIPSHTKQGNTRYRYYVTPVDDPGDPVRLPAVELEKLVVKAIVNWLSSDKQVVDAVGWKNAQLAGMALKQAQQLSQNLQKTPKTTLPAAVRRVEVGPNSLRITLDLVGSGLQTQGPGPGEATIEVPAARKRCGMAVRLIIGEQGPAKLQKRDPDPSLVNLMVKGRLWLNRLTHGGLSLEAIAQQDKVSARYVSRVIHVALLAPDIVKGIEQGDHPLAVTATKLITSVPFPAAWQAQREQLGMGQV